MNVKMKPHPTKQLTKYLEVLLEVLSVHSVLAVWSICEDHDEAAEAVLPVLKNDSVLPLHMTAHLLGREQLSTSAVSCIYIAVCS